jgi:hypothetical protein
MQVKFKIWSLVFGVALACMSGFASADTLFVTFIGTSGTGTTFNYDVTLSGSSSVAVQVAPGDFATIIDFGPVLGSIVYTGNYFGDWAASQAAFGPIPTHPFDLTPVANDTPVLNLTFTWTGAVDGTLSPSPDTGSIDLGVFSVTDATGATQTTSSAWVSQDHEAAVPPGTTFSLAEHIDTTTVPFGQPGNLTPLPSSVWGGMALFGLLGCGAVSRKVRQVA